MHSRQTIKLAVYYVTAPSNEIALKLSQMLLNSKLIACCNIVDNVQSVYFWEGKLNQDKEVLMIMKSREALINQITELVTKNHPYSVPEVIGMPIVVASGAYRDFVIENTKDPTPSKRSEDL